MCRLVLTRQFIYGNHAALLNRMLRHRQTLNNVTHRQSANNFVVNLDDPFLLPDLKLPEQPKVEIGIWGAGVRRTPLPQAEALTEPTGETSDI